MSKTHDPYKDLARFYEKKRKEPAGGKNFMVKSKGKILGTMWARSKKELEELLNKKRQHFDSLTELI